MEVDVMKWGSEVQMDWSNLAYVAMLVYYNAASGDFEDNAPHEAHSHRLAHGAFAGYKLGYGY